jgi:ATP-dependent exoDNAse (exonuclease V) beta subunit
VFPALVDDAARAVERAGDDDLAPLERVAEDARSIRRSRESAEARVERPVSRPASEDPEREAEAADDPESAGAGAGGAERRAARAVGTAIHRLLEQLDLDGDPAEELERLRPRVAAWLAGALPDDERAGEWARARAEQLLERLGQGPLLPRLRDLREHVVARELPALSPPPREEGAPVGFVPGAIDLLYRDPETGGLVVADFKTDHIQVEASLAAHARRYVAQGVAYTRAVREALVLEERPRFELWFLDPGRIEVVEL